MIFGRFRYECVTNNIVPKDMYICFHDPNLSDEEKYNFSNLIMMKKGKTVENVQNRKQQAVSQGKTIVELDKDGSIIKRFRSMHELVKELNMANRQNPSKKMNELGGKGIYVKDDRRFTWEPDPDLQGEIWKTIFISKEGDIFTTMDNENNNANHYYVSNYGRIYTDVTNKWYGTSQPNGYMVIRSRGKNMFIHKLVAIAFFGPSPHEGMTANHKDKNPKNNCIDNLEWMTQSEQTLHATGKHYKLTHKDTNESHVFLGVNSVCDFLKDNDVTKNPTQSTLSTALSRLKKRKTFIGNTWHPECITRDEYDVHVAKKRKLEDNRNAVADQGEFGDNGEFKEFAEKLGVKYNEIPSFSNDDKDDVLSTSVIHGKEEE